jgi:hypothetical protein
MLHALGEVHFNPIGVDIGIIVGRILGSKRIRNVDIDAANSIDKITEIF